MFYRRKVLLALLQQFDGQLEKIRLQKLLFLFCQRQTKAEYDFIPYKYGCYSYSANADLTTMVKKGMISEDQNSFICQESTNYLKELKENDRIHLTEVKKRYKELDGTALMKYTYIHYPFFATNSVKAKEMLTDAEFQKVDKSRPSSEEVTLFTIGYEGISLEKYLTRLIKNNVRVLVDVRNNPQSMKYGFSKNQLSKYCESLGINYIHFPEVGIQSDQRQELKDQKDYDRLFDEYKSKNLTNTQSTQVAILNLLIEHRRIALTCFEANICQCHRKHLAESIECLDGFKYSIKHI
ncbi:DUF488 domain-containing protein [Chitinophagaceae bacterium 26-R-25]|nr:DUF488 domain-containing protein [Chitinophagaceae bacterium 26-R-25]